MTIELKDFTLPPINLYNVGQHVYGVSMIVEKLGKAEQSIETLWHGKADSYDAGYDLVANIGSAWVIRGSDKSKLVPTGIKVEIPIGHVGLLMPRSGKGHKEGLVLGNTIGVIDASYRGEIFISVTNSGKGSTGSILIIEPGERIAQLIVMPISLTKVTFDDVGGSNRGTGGFGSTGK